jgi:hypothetical protein
LEEAVGLALHLSFPWNQFRLEPDLDCSPILTFGGMFM